MKLAICNEMFEDWKIEDVFDCAAQLGYRGVEIAPFTLADDVRDISSNRRDQIKKSAANSQIEIVGLHWLLVSPKGLYVNHPDNEIREKTLDYFLALIDQSVLLSLSLQMPHLRRHSFNTSSYYRYNRKIMSMPISRYYLSRNWLWI